MELSVLFLLVYSFRLSVSVFPQDGQTCDNGCVNNSSDGHKYWCNQRRQGEGESVLRCAEFTRYGQACVSDCDYRGRQPLTSGKYTWCLTGYHLGAAYDWEYCAKEGVTMYGHKCVDECQQKGESYWWCNIDHPWKWDYCSPPAKAIPVSYTINGQLCTDTCDQHGENYWWCHKSRRWKTSRGDDDWWDYCSPDSQHTRYNERCTSECHSYWCNTGNIWGWDYCSTPVDLNYTYTNEGRMCAGKCFDSGCAAQGLQGRVNSYSQYREPCDRVTAHHAENNIGMTNFVGMVCILLGLLAILVGPGVLVVYYRRCRH